MKITLFPLTFDATHNSTQVNSELNPTQLNSAPRTTQLHSRQTSTQINSELNSVHFATQFNSTHIPTELNSTQLTSQLNSTHNPTQLDWQLSSTQCTSIHNSTEPNTEHKSTQSSTQLNSQRNSTEVCGMNSSRRNLTMRVLEDKATLAILKNYQVNRGGAGTSWREVSTIRRARKWRPGCSKNEHSELWVCGMNSSRRDLTIRALQDKATLAILKNYQVNRGGGGSSWREVSTIRRARKWKPGCSKNEHSKLWVCGMNSSRRDTTIRALQDEATLAILKEATLAK